MAKMTRKNVDAAKAAAEKQLQRLLDISRQRIAAPKLLAEERRLRNATRAVPRPRPNVPGVEIAGRKNVYPRYVAPAGSEARAGMGVGKELDLREIPMRTRVLSKSKVAATAAKVEKGAVAKHAAAKAAVGQGVRAARVVTKRLARRVIGRTAANLAGRGIGLAFGPLGAAAMGVFTAYEILDGLGAFDSGGEKRAEALELKTRMQEAMAAVQMQHKAEGLGRLAGTIEGIQQAREETDALSLGVPGLDQVMDQNLEELQAAVPPMKPTQGMLAAAMGLSSR